MERIKRIILSGLPLVIVGGLLYAGLFIKPKAIGKAVEQPLVERGDAFYGIVALPTGVVWASGSNGKILRSDNAGRTWRKEGTASRETLQDIAAWDARRAVAVGNEGVVLTTEDAGRSWAPAQAPKSAISNKLMRVRTSQDGSAWAVGSGGMLLYSRDYGKSWQSAAQGEDTAWNGIAFDGQRGCVVGEFGRILISNDAGETWKSAGSPVERSLMSIGFKDTNHAVAVGLRGTVLVSNNGGASWTVADKVTEEDLLDVAWDGKRWIVVGDKGVVLMAGEDAAKWRLTRFEPQDRNWYTKVQTQDGKYYVAGSRLAVSDAEAL